MDGYEEELNKEEMPTEEKAEETSEGSLKEVKQMLADGEAAIADGSKTRDEVINEMISALQDMVAPEEEANDVMGGLGDTGGFPMPEAE